MKCMCTHFAAGSDSTATIRLTFRDEQNMDMPVTDYIFTPDKPYCIKNVKSLRESSARYVPVEEFWEVYDSVMKQFSELEALRQD